ncbi:hypothetical protein Ciccas_008743 [Cichlidogyrus casuarinus]|uniref:Uncharacterized protein n=1 Tax=Cichlidogyrus casuarinus TaxID=1844966 RepID=A0ABD2PZ84_9PLAT
MDRRKPCTHNTDQEHFVCVPIASRLGYIFDHFSASGMALLFLIFCQCVAFSWCVGFDRLKTVALKITGIHINLYWKINWVILCPAVCLSVCVYSSVEFRGVEYENYEFPSWTYLIGGAIALSSVVCIPIYMLCYLTVKIRERNRTIQADRKPMLKFLSDIIRPEIKFEEFYGIGHGQEGEVLAESA